MDFGALPPEINSARMYSGPGSAPMLTAAAAWDGLAAELHTAAAGYQSVTSELTGGPWQGAASASMTAAAAPYLAWLHTTAAQAEQAATRARAAASAFEAARAMTVPPPVVAANRMQLMSLLSTNILGQNTPAIAATEAHYGAMWAQDATAMYGYAAAAAAASKVTPFTSSPSTTNPAGLTTSPLMSAIPRTLQGLASPASAASPALASSWSSAQSLLDSVSGHTRTTTSALTLIVGATGLARAAGLTTSAGAIGVPVGTATLAGTTGASGLSGLGTGDGVAVSAQTGRATRVGALSVPQNWAGPVQPAISPAAVASPSAGSNTGLAGMPVMPIGGMGGRGAGRSADASRILRPLRMVPRSPAGG